MRFLLASWIAMQHQSSSPTVIVGLNGALQKRFVLQENASLIPGNVHRASSVQAGVGGKGQDVAIALSCLDYEGTQLAEFIGSGAEGDFVYAALEDLLGSQSMQSLTVRPKSHMRTCTTIVSSDASTELVEPSGEVAEEDIDSLFQKLEDQKEETAALCFMGSMPPKCPENMYGSIYERVNKGSSTLCLIDSVNGLEDLFKAMADSPCKKSLLKLNASELCRLAGVSKANNEADGVALAELEEAVSSFLQKYEPASKSLSGLAITDGKHPAHLVALDASSDNTVLPTFKTYMIPVVDLSGKSNLLYPIGAGDTVAAGTLAAWRSCRMLSSGDNSNCLNNEVQAALKSYLESTEKVAPDTDVQHMVSAFAFGLSCGSASCLKEENSVFDTNEALKLLNDMGPPKAL